MAFLLNIQLLSGLCVFPSCSSGGRSKAHSTVPTNGSHPNFCLFFLFPRHFGKCALFFKSGLLSATFPISLLHQHSESKGNLHKSVLLLLVKGIKGLCFLPAYVTQSSESVNRESLHFVFSFP